MDEPGARPRTRHLDETDRVAGAKLGVLEAVRSGVTTLGECNAKVQIGLDDQVGSIETGNRADLVLVDALDPGVAPVVDEPLATAIPNLVFAAGPTAVDGVLVDGEWVVRYGAFRPVDARSVVAEVQERAHGAFDRAADDWRAGGSELVGQVADGCL